MMFLFASKQMVMSTEPWWLSGLACQSIANSMLKVEGSNPGASILKLVFSNFQSVCSGLELTSSFGCIVCTKYCTDN